MNDIDHLNSRISRLEARLAILERIVRSAVPSQGWPTGIVWGYDEPPKDTLAERKKK